MVTGRADGNLQERRLRTSSVTWHRTDPDDGGVVAEWERDDGWATIRLRRRGDDAWVVRLDRLTQAPEGSLYREARVERRAAADRVVEEWRAEYDTPSTA